MSDEALILSSTQHSRLVARYSYPDHQLDFVTPGISPRRLKKRKQILHILNRLRNPLTRPQRGHRLYRLTLNFGSLAAFNRNAFRDTVLSAYTDRDGSGAMLRRQDRLLLTPHPSLVKP